MKILLFLVAFALIPPVSSGESLRPPDEIAAIDKPSDDGKAIILTWKKMDFENEDVFYVPLISEKDAGPFFQLKQISALNNFKSDMPGVFGFRDGNEGYHAVEIKNFKRSNALDPNKIETIPLIPGNTYYVGLKVLGPGGEFALPAAVTVVPVGNYFSFNKLNLAVTFIVLMVLIFLFISLAKRNPDLFIRKIAGLDSIEDALGRATEMGKSVLFVHGLKYISEVSTIAAINILGRIAKKVAEFDTPLKVANWDPIIQQVSRETVRESYIEAGRPDAYKEENVFFAASEQFSYAAAVEGIMVREKPAANFYFGYFYAESLLLSETGAMTGAIQIAGTDAFTQIPFFITTCDYTLIGEELYAASAYLSRMPKLLGSLKGQDMGKLGIILMLIIGTITVSFGWDKFAKLFWPL